VELSRDSAARAQSGHRRRACRACIGPRFNDKTAVFDLSPSELGGSAPASFSRITPRRTSNEIQIRWTMPVVALFPIGSWSIALADTSDVKGR
jgi:hypothetical protein